MQLKTKGRVVQDDVARRPRAATPTQRLEAMFGISLGLCVTIAIGAGGGGFCFAQVSPDDPKRSPCQISVSLQPGDSGNVVQVDFTLPQRFVLYADRLHFFSSTGTELVPLQIAEPVVEWDKTSSRQRQEYTRSFAARLELPDAEEKRLLVKFQGCTNGACFFPETRVFSLQNGGAFVEVRPEGSGLLAVSPSGSSNWLAEAKGFKVLGQQAGYLTPSQFTAFLDRAVSGAGATDEPLSRFQNLGLAMTLLLILTGGFLLNFTPCVLPMIPINLAVIGAGAKASNRTAGFRNGGLYGIGMALAYGALGLAVVLTGAKFGTLNSSVAFNVVVSLVFVVLALGMFDVLTIDLSRFLGGSRWTGGSGGNSSILRQTAILAMGALAALLAGACVAPVVLSVILLSTNLYARGNLAGLMLPFLLGVGMALPWPFAGAGLTFLPKPGKWMKNIKYGFGVLIIGFACYYARAAYHALELSPGKTGASLALARAERNPTSFPNEPANHQLGEALEQARSQGRAVFIDFHASWCKSCLAMEETVFNQPVVRKRLEDFVVIRYAAEQPNELPAREVLDHFGVIGLPAYVVVAPK